MRPLEPVEAEELILGIADPQILQASGPIKWDTTVV